MTNSKQEYNDFVRANLPGSIRYDSVRNRYVTANNKYFVTYKEAKWYVDYLVKRGSNLAYAEGGYTPSTILDYSGQKSYVGGNLTSSFDDVVTATRTGLATQLDASGNLVWNAHNLIPYSEDGTQWTNLGSTDQDLTAGLPNGISQGFKLVEDTSSGQHRMSITGATLSVGGSYTFSSWVKAGERSVVWLYSSAADRGIFFDLSSLIASNAFGAGSATTSGTIIDAGDGWYLCSLVVEDVSGSSGVAIVGVSTGSGTLTYLGDGASGAFFAGAHVYRSDLGGMAPVPLTRRVAGSTTYVPTTSAAVYLPREEAYTYVSGSLVGPYYQKESDARTNLITYSEDFTDASWVYSTAVMSLTANAGVSPSGQSDATLFTPDTATNVRQLGVSGFPSSDYTFSIYAKSNGGSNDQISIWLAGYTQRAVFDLGAGTVNNINLTSASIENVGNGWYRCVGYSSTATTNVRVYMQDGNAFAGNDSDGVYLWGAQLE